MECAECEGNVYQGHAPDCSRRCQAKHSTRVNGVFQCERRVDHGGLHGIYGPDEEDGLQFTWPYRG